MAVLTLIKIVSSLIMGIGMFSFFPRYTLIDSPAEKIGKFFTSLTFLYRVFIIPPFILSPLNFE